MESNKFGKWEDLHMISLNLFITLYYGSKACVYCGIIIVMDSKTREGFRFNRLRPGHHIYFSTVRIKTKQVGSLPTDIVQAMVCFYGVDDSCVCFAIPWPCLNRTRIRSLLFSSSAFFSVLTKFLLRP